MSAFDSVPEKSLDPMAFAADGVLRLRVGLFALFAMLLAASFIQLNAQKVLYAYLGLDFTETATRPAITLLWVLVPAALWSLVPLILLIRARVQTSQLPLLAWLAILAAHSVFFTLTDGPRAGIASFLSWGAWACLPLIVQGNWGRRFPRYVMVLFILAAVANALPILYEWAVGEPIFKEVTRAGVTRSYGISQSISVAGLQLAVGSIALIHQMSLCPRNSLRFVGLTVMLLTVIGALLATSSRAPIIFLLFGLALLVSISRLPPAFKVIGGLLVAIGAFMLALAAVSSLFDATYLEFLIEALSVRDDANLERFGIYLEAYARWSHSWETFLFGYGSGSLSALAPYFGNTDIAAESSLLKLVIELGLIGGLPLLVFVLTVLWQANRERRRSSDSSITFFFVMTVLVLLEASIHESLKAWIIQFYFWALLASLVSFVTNVEGKRAKFCREERSELGG